MGNTLEDLLGIEENNLPIPNASEWELKAQRKFSKSLTTLLHLEPSPQGAKLVSTLLLPYYGWRHKLAGTKHAETERSFRSTTYATGYTDRGFTIVVDRSERKVKVSFDAAKVAEKHKEWVSSIEKTIGLGELNPQPYWGFDDLMYTVGSKLRNAFYVLAENKWEGDDEYFYFTDVDILTGFDFDNFLHCIEQGIILIDFDASTHHNHGTKFRMRQNNWPKLYSSCTRIV